MAYEGLRVRYPTEYGWDGIGWPPGSIEAFKRSCSCDRKLNRNGRGIEWGRWTVLDGCRYHRKPGT